MSFQSFKNVPTPTGGVVSGYISVASGSPFGLEGRFASQVAQIQSTIAKAPIGTYDADFFRDFDVLPVNIPTGYNFISSDDPEIIAELQKIPEVIDALYVLNSDYAGRLEKYPPRTPLELQEQQKVTNAKNVIAIHVKRLMLEKNAPLIKAQQEQKAQEAQIARQLEINQAVQIALEQKVRETATPKPTPTPTPTAPATISSFPIIPIIIIAVIIGFFLLRRRA